MASRALHASAPVVIAVAKLDKAEEDELPVYARLRTHRAWVMYQLSGLSPGACAERMAQKVLREGEASCIQACINARGKPKTLA